MLYFYIIAFDILRKFTSFQVYLHWLLMTPGRQHIVPDPYLFKHAKFDLDTVSSGQCLNSIPDHIRQELFYPSASAKNCKWLYIMQIIDFH